MGAARAKTCPSCGERYDADVLFCSRDGTPLALARHAGATPSSPDADPYINIELAGQIVLRSLIGIGSMGRVYRAWQGGIERDVAVKILHRELSGNQELVKRFHREAKVASRLVHPNVVQVLMTGIAPFATSLSSSVDPSFIGGELYLVMEHLDGISLLSALAAAGAGGEAQALPLPRALHVTLQLCDAVGEAHMQKIVHRDLKPENVMLVRRGEDRDYVKVLDFGIARLDWNEKGMETQAGLIFGSAKYISPEGADGQPVGPEADVYAIATMLYQMLAGRTPFEGDSPVAILVQHAHAPPTDLREIARASYVPAPIASVVMQNLSKKPRDRAVDARQLRRDLMAAARASGLFPEELSMQASLAEGAASVKLASNQRTKSLELSVDLAKKIGGVAAVPQDAPVSSTPQGSHPPGSQRAPTTEVPVVIDATPAPRSARGLGIGSVRMASSAVLAGPPAGAPRAKRQVMLHEVLDEEDAAASAAAGPTAPSAAEVAEVGPPEPTAQLDFDDAHDAPARTDTEPPSLPPPLPVSTRPAPAARTSQPMAESPRSSRPRPTPVATAVVEAPRSSGRGRARLASDAAPMSSPRQPPVEAVNAIDPQPAPPSLAVPSADAPVNDSLGEDAGPPPPVWKRYLLAAAVVLAVAPVAIFGGRQLGTMANGRGNAGDTIEVTLEHGREAMHKHAWTAPAEANVKDLLTTAQSKWPDDPRVQEVRHEAAEMLVSDALGRKYAGDVPDAIRLARLALELDAKSTTAQHLVVELEGAEAPRAPTPRSDGPRGDHRQHPAAELPEPVSPPLVTTPPPSAPQRPQTPTSTGPWL